MGMLEILRDITMDKVNITGLVLPDYMRPRSLHLVNGTTNNGIMNIIHIDKEATKNFSGGKKNVDYLTFSSTGGITVHFVEGRQPRDLMSENSARFGLDGVDEEIMNQIFPEELMNNFEVPGSILNIVSSTEEASGLIIDEELLKEIFGDL